MIGMEKPVPGPPLPAGDDPEPIEAIVLRQPPVRVLYPYAPNADLIGAPATPIAQWLRRDTPPPVRTYVVPKRFGISAILALMTGMAVLFGFMRVFDAPPVLYLFFSTMALAICIAQMVWGNMPRQASIGVGAIVAPVFVVIAVLAEGSVRDLWRLPCALVFSVMWGALFGYLTGTCAAGIFLVMEILDPYLPGGRRRQAAQSASNDEVKPHEQPVGPAGCR
jgi:hypothetical protein